MTSPNGYVPDEAYVSGGSGQSGLSDLNDLTEGVAKQRMQGAIVPSFNNHRDSIWSTFDNIAASVANVFNTFFGRFFKPPEMSTTIVEVVDGQLEINNRIDLLANNGYCAMTLGYQVRIPAGLLRAVPFNVQIGPKNFAEPVTVNRQHPGSGSGSRDERCIRLDRPGLWNAEVAMVQSQSSWESFAEIVVLKPDLTPYTYLSMPTPTGASSGSAGGNDLPSKGSPITLSKMFVIPEAGYYVQVRYQCISGGAFHPRIRGGAKYAMFAVTQWSGDVAATGAVDDPSAEIVIS